MNVLFLCPHELYTRKCSRCRIHQMEHVGEHDSVDNFYVTGVGFPDYDERRTLDYNLLNLQFTPDVIHLYKSEVRGVLECKVPKSIDFNESWPHNPGRALGEANRCGVDIVIHHHENDASAFSGHNGPIVHIPHCASGTIFFAPVDKERPIDCLFTGVASEQMYPVRQKLLRLILNGEIPGDIRPHMGGKQFHSGSNSYRADGLAACNRQFEDYAQHLSRAKISLCCTSKWKYALCKIVESMMAGCAVVTDMPDDEVFKKTLGPHIIEVDPQWSSQEITDLIEGWLNRPADLAAKAAAGQNAAMNGFTMRHYAGLYISVVKRFLRDV